jgi:anaerobic magnesium-protoporphyrin IX monomethyl ester cyclase
MHVLLAHSFYLKNDPKQTGKMHPYPPLGTLYAASHLRSLGYAVSLFDAMFAAGPEEFEQVLDRDHPTVVVLYEDQFHFLNKMCLSHSRDAACRMSAMARLRGATVIAAGSDVSDHPEEYLRQGVEYALIGEADHTLAELLAVLSGGDGTVGMVAGIAMAAGRTPPRPPERNADVFPFPAWDLLDVEQYRRAWLQSHGYFSVNMVSTRGCPFHCNWCAKPIWGQHYAMRSPANVAEEMAVLKRDIQPDHIWFADDIFGLQPKWVVEFAREVETRNASVPFTIQSRVDLMTEEAVAALAQANCSEVWLGVESGSQKILDAMDKGITVDDAVGARHRLRDAGIRACFFLQFGYPGETFEDILATVRLVRESLPDDIGVSVSNPLPRTKFYQMVKAELGVKDHWEDSGDLAMMFQGTYQTLLYRKLHDLLHSDLELRIRLRDAPELQSSIQPCLDQLNCDLLDLSQAEASYHNANPTVIRKYYPTVNAPDLGSRWN